MADPSSKPPTEGAPSPAPAGPSPGERRQGSAPSQASVPPSSRATFEALDAQVDRPARVQMIVALVLGLVLVAVPLYLLRRPRAEAIPVSTANASGAPLPVATAGTTPSVDEKLVVGEARTLSCHDPGTKKTPPEQCDRLPEIEKALAKAIEDNAACVPRDAGGGTIQYVVDVAFKKKSVSLSTPKESRTLKNAKAAGGCERVVRNKLAGVPLDGMKHEHARYRVAITATYPGPVRP